MAECDYGPDDVQRVLGAVRRACRSLPEVTERPSHGGPAFFVREKKCFLMFLDDHHGDGRLAVWCAAPEGVQAEMVATEPTRFFRPPYVGHRGWLGVQLTQVEGAELEAIVTEAYTTVAPRSLLSRPATDS